METVLFTDEDKDILQEIMNIAFGNATADLARVIDIYVNLSIPNIQIIDVGKLTEYIKKTMNTSEKSCIVDQKFSGNFNGSGVLVFPEITGSDLIHILDTKTSSLKKNKADEFLAQDILSELGNILIGASVGKISGLLQTSVAYSPPQIINGNGEELKCLIDSYLPQQTAIVMKTLFSFKEKNINGFLLIITNHESIKWLRSALHEFMKEYE